MGTINIRNVPEEIHRRAKAAAATAGDSLQDWVIQAISDKLEVVNMKTYIVKYQRITPPQTTEHADSVEVQAETQNDAYNIGMGKAKKKHKGSNIYITDVRPK